ncbi:RHS repeat-associated core domain-containing protein [Lentimicrobium sp. L6]|uniref:RHS repeat-associated core domain-containing protein n=1 Tax=Lentimicrobium sp. L6 TaxID=2735916 RepID=UPI0015579316|nr:RHS repeat-associated core domain-containing protein [Lentimicrobium sp. L6]NPD83136.1 RHS repeat-associated core domain-containing protein [Lentimicrobium sp. L6]
MFNGLVISVIWRTDCKSALAGFTGHEHIDLFELVNMNGRIYDPVIARFLSPDPFVQAPENSQGLNRYSYAWNNPLVIIDPSGYINRTQFGAMVAGMIVSAAIIIATAGSASPAVAAAWVTLAGAAGALTSGIIMMINSKVSFSQALPYLFMSTIIGGLSGAITAGIGDISLFKSEFLNLIARIPMHGTYQGLMNITQGGKFLHGMIAAAAAQLGGAVGYINDISESATVGLNMIVSAVLGGVATKMTGGNFANGAITASFIVLFNHYVHSLFRRKLADKIRNSQYWGVDHEGVALPNHYYKAVAMYIDIGGTLTGAEADTGVFFILAGKDKGSFVAFKEVAGGASPSGGIGIEFGRVDFSGPADKFSSTDLFGMRVKSWVSVSVADIGRTTGYTIAGYEITTTSVTLGISLSPFGPFSGGYNKGEVKPYH